VSKPHATYRTATATQGEIFRHLCSACFTPRLGERVDLVQYSKKLTDNAVTFEAWNDDTLVGLVAAYFNDPTNQRGFITSVSTVEAHQGRGVAKALMQRCLIYGRSRGFREVYLEVHRENTAAICLYRSCGFVDAGLHGDNWIMKLALAAERPIESVRKGNSS
jgi:ribosomal protein S18 acetylase RimI-like enzyme